MAQRKEPGLLGWMGMSGEGGRAATSSPAPPGDGNLLLSSSCRVCGLTSLGLAGCSAQVTGLSSAEQGEANLLMSSWLINGSLGETEVLQEM